MADGPPCRACLPGRSGMHSAHRLCRLRHAGGAWLGQRQALSRLRGASSFPTLPPCLKFVPSASANGKVRQRSGRTARQSLGLPTELTSRGASRARRTRRPGRSACSAGCRWSGRRVPQRRSCSSRSPATPRPARSCSRLASGGRPAAARLQRPASQAPPPPDLAVLDRLQKQGLQVLVERGVHHTEFQQFDIFEPEQHGALAALLGCSWEQRAAHTHAARALLRACPGGPLALRALSAACQAASCTEAVAAASRSPARCAVDLGVTLGGDGTVLHLASLFAEDVPLPPVVSFAMGTLGFLTPFDVDGFESILNRVLDANSNHVYCTLRTRKRCEVLTYVRRLAGCCTCLRCLPGHALVHQEPWLTRLLQPRLQPLDREEPAACSTCGSVCCTYHLRCSALCTAGEPHRVPALREACWAGRAG